MNSSEKEILQAIAAVQTNQQVTQTHVEYIAKSVKRMDERLTEREKREASVLEKLSCLENKTQSLPEIEEKILKKSFQKDKLLSVIAPILAALTIGVSLTCDVKSCSFDGIESKSGLTIEGVSEAAE